MSDQPREPRLAPTAKETVRALLDELPADTTLEEIQYRLYVRELLQQRLEIAENATLVTQAEAEARMSRWLGR